VIRASKERKPGHEWTINLGFVDHRAFKALDPWISNLTHETIPLTTPPLSPNRLTTDEPKSVVLEEGPAADERTSELLLPYLENG
jgi:hypothetical protein